MILDAIFMFLKFREKQIITNLCSKNMIKSNSYFFNMYFVIFLYEIKLGKT